jgi:hypothetical protein
MNRRKQLRRYFWIAACAVAFASSGYAQEQTPAEFQVPASPWVVTNFSNGPASDVAVTGSPDAPLFTPADGITVMQGIEQVSLEDGESIRASGEMTVSDIPFGAFLPIQFRLGLFQEEGPGPSTGDGDGYVGITMENSGRVKETQATSNPFSSTGSRFVALMQPDEEGDGLPPMGFTALFELIIRRDGAGLDMQGSIAVGPDFLQQFAVEDYVPVAVDFHFNRVGFLVGATANAGAASLANVQVTVVPEPAARAMVLVAAVGVVSCMRPDVNRTNRSRAAA